MEDSCAHCKKTNAELSKPLKRCAKCKSTNYCSRDCQKTDWKQHKKVCGRTANASTSSAGPFQIHTVDSSTMHDTMFGDVLAGLAKEEVYKRLIDSYRLRVEDEYSFEGNNRGVYAGRDPMADFRNFLDRAETKKVLPEWWNKERRVECEELGGTKSGWSDLSCSVEKHDVQEHYNDNMMPMKIRILAERIYGRRIGF